MPLSTQVTSTPSITSRTLPVGSRPRLGCPALLLQAWPWVDARAQEQARVGSGSSGRRSPARGGLGSTERIYALGDESWRKLLGRFRVAVRRSLKRYGGREIDTAGDGFFIAFEAPGRALRCARMIVETLADLDLEVRIGAHIGEVHVDGRHVTGGAVHIASRVMAIAAPGEVLVSRALRDVVAGSDIELADRGIHQLKGVPGEFQLYAASSHSFYLTWIRNGAPCELLHFYGSCRS